MQLPWNSGRQVLAVAITKPPPATVALTLPKSEQPATRFLAKFVFCKAVVIYKK